MKEQIITFETAKLAKEKGFDEHSNNYKYYEYLENDEFDDPRSGDLIVFKKKGDIKLEHGYNKCKNNNWLAPTQSLLQRWLREKHNIYIELMVDGWGQDEKVTSDMLGYRAFVWEVGEPRPLPYEDLGMSDYETILEIALEHSLKLIKNKTK